MFYQLTVEMQSRSHRLSNRKLFGEFLTPGVLSKDLRFLRLLALIASDGIVLQTLVILTEKEKLALTSFECLQIQF